MYTLYSTHDTRVTHDTSLHLQLQLPDANAYGDAFAFTCVAAGTPPQEVRPGDEAPVDSLPGLDARDRRLPRRRRHRALRHLPAPGVRARIRGLRAPARGRGRRRRHRPAGGASSVARLI